MDSYNKATKVGSCIFKVTGLVAGSSFVSSFVSTKTLAAGRLASTKKQRQRHLRAVGRIKPKRYYPPLWHGITAAFLLTAISAIVERLALGDADQRRVFLSIMYVLGGVWLLPASVRLRMLLSPTQWGSVRDYPPFRQPKRAKRRLL